MDQIDRNLEATKSQSELCHAVDDKRVTDDEVRRQLTNYRDACGTYDAAVKDAAALKLWDQSRLEGLTWSHDIAAARLLQRFVGGQHDAEAIALLRRAVEMAAVDRKARGQTLNAVLASVPKKS